MKTSGDCLARCGLFSGGLGYCSDLGGFVVLRVCGGLGAE